MKKICFLIGNLNLTGGTERVTSILANILYKQSYDISILSIYEGLNPAFKISQGINLFQLFSNQVSMKTKFLKSVSNLRNFIKKNKIDTLIVVDSICCVFSVPACMGTKINHICWEHFNFKVNLGSHFRNLGRWMAAKWCDKIVTLTERDKNFWIQSYPNIKEKIFVISNPSLHKNVDHKPSLENKVVLAVGRLDYIKGFDLLLKSWALVCKETDEKWILNIVGGGREEHNLKKLVDELQIENRVIFSGQQKNIDPYYRNAAFYCLSSRNEGFPMVLLEAQSYGLPIVAFNCDTGPAEIVINNENGYLCKAEDVNDLAMAIKKVIFMNNSKYTDFCISSRKNIEKFTIKEIFSKWEECL